MGNNSKTEWLLFSDIIITLDINNDIIYNLL
jgi:hypothetical protein